MILFRNTDFSARRLVNFDLSDGCRVLRRCGCLSRLFSRRDSYSRRSINGIRLRDMTHTMDSQYPTTVDVEALQQLHRHQIAQSDNGGSGRRCSATPYVRVSLTDVKNEILLRHLRPDDDHIAPIDSLDDET